MRAQKVEDPSMEDILSSIRKIISEDGNENENSASDNNVRAVNSEVPQEALQEREQQPSPHQATSQQPASAMHQSQPPASEHRNSASPIPASNKHPETRTNQEAPASRPLDAQRVQQPVLNVRGSTDQGIGHSQQAPVMSERREYLDMDSSAPPSRQPNRTVPEQHSVSSESSVFAEKPNPMIRPAVHTPPQVENKVVEETQKVGEPANTGALRQPGQPSNKAIPGFVETKPPIEDKVHSVENDAGQNNTSLHPAIANAKSFVSIQGNDRNSVSETRNKTVETPVFADPQLSPDASMGKLVSPDNAERRQPDERRNHPLRRGVDRLEGEIKNELMSVETTNSVHSAFEQLKDLTTENLDQNVKEMIRPMLREWLDNNLPSMVERLVRDEIERVSRGE